MGWPSSHNSLCLALCSYTAKLHADECDDEKGSPRSTVAEYFLHYVKMGLGVQRLQQEQMCAIAKTTLEHVSSNPRFEVFALWSGLIEPSTYSIFTSVLTLEIIKRVIRPPTVEFPLAQLALQYRTTCLFAGGAVYELPVSLRPAVRGLAVLGVAVFHESHLEFCVHQEGSGL